MTYLSNESHSLSSQPSKQVRVRKRWCQQFMSSNKLVPLTLALTLLDVRQKPNLSTICNFAFINGISKVYCHSIYSCNKFYSSGSKLKFSFKMKIQATWVHPRDWRNWSSKRRKSREERKHLKTSAGGSPPTTWLSSPPSSRSVGRGREVLLKGNARYGWPPYTN